LGKLAWISLKLTALRLGFPKQEGNHSQQGDSMRLISKLQRETVLVKRFKRFTVKFTLTLWMQLEKFSHLAHQHIVHKVGFQALFTIATIMVSMITMRFLILSL